MCCLENAGHFVSTLASKINVCPWPPTVSIYRYLTGDESQHSWWSTRPIMKEGRQLLEQPANEASCNELILEIAFWGIIFLPALMQYVP